MFLARAFDEIARAVYGEQWIEQVKEPDDPDDLGPDVPPDDCSDEEFEEWERACDQAETEFQDLQAKLADMKAGVARMIAEQCELGHLVTAARRKHGGEMTELGQHHWNIDDLRIRFFRCDISLAHPFASDPVSGNDCWIYVMRVSLDHFLMAQPHGTPSGGGDQYLSPYLKVMLAVSKKMGITAANQPKKSAVAEEIRSAWRLDPLSAKLIETMATLIRDPDSQRGKAKKNTPPKKA